MQAYPFTPNLEGMIDALEKSEDVSFVLDRELRLQYRNSAWNHFAIKNDAPELAMETVIGTDSLIRVCMHCRCSRRVNDAVRWDFVPADLNRKLANVTHSLCPVCMDYFYPKQRTE